MNKALFMKWFSVLLLFVITGLNVLGQASTGNYSFATNTSGSLALDDNGNTIDMSTGTTNLVAGAAIDDGASTLNLLPFEFYLNGARYTQYSASSNGVMQLGAVAVSGTLYNTSGGSVASPRISAFAADGATGVGGKVHSKLVGTAPNRCLVVEFLMNLYWSSGTPLDGTYQVRFYESTNKLEFVYGAMSITDNSITFDGTVGIGFSTGVGSNSFASVASASNTVSTTGSFADNALYPNGPITNLNSAANGSRRVYSFTPVAAAAASALNFSAVSAVGMTLNWTDNSTDEAGFAIFRSTDGINYTYLSQTAANVVSSVQAGLLPSTNYFWRVSVVREAPSAIFASGSQLTSAPGNITSVGTGLWSATTTWVGGVVPTAGDNVIIADGSIVTIDIPNAACLDLTVGQGTSGELNYIGSPASALSVGFNVTVAAGGSFNAGAGVLTTHGLAVGGNLTNNGTLDFFTTAGVGITFTGAGSNSFGGSGGVTDIRTIIINKGTSNANVLELNPANFTVQGTTTDGTPMAFLTLTNGTFKISGTFPLTGRVFGVAGYSIPANAGFWLNNPNVTVTGQNAIATSTGLFRITQGTFNHGTAAGNSFNLATNSTTIIEGGTLSFAGRFGTTAAATVINYTQTSGTITVCTVGYTSTALASFDLGTSVASSIIISGGTIVCQLANSAATGPRDFRNNGGAGIATVTGGLLQLGNASSGAAKSFLIGNVTPNILVTSTSGSHTATFNTILTNYNNVSLNITTEPTATINLGNGVFLFNGTSITNDGVFTHNGVSSRFITFRPATNMTFAGTGTITAPVTSLELQNDLNFTITSVNNIAVSRIIIFSGNFVNANKITLGTGGATPTTVQIGNGTTPTAGGTFDTAPNFNLGLGGQSVSYLRTTTSKTTGPEINPGRTLVALTHNDNDPTHTLTIAGGALSTTTLNLTNGKIVNGANLLTVTGTTVTNITGGSATAYVTGALARTLPASLPTGTVYPFPIGKGTLNALELVNPTTNAGGTVTVQAEVFDANSGGTPGTLMQSLNTSRYWAASITAGAGNFTNTLLRLNDTRGTQDGIAASATVNGVYDHVGGTASTNLAESITTTPPELTSIGNFYLMGNLGAAVLTNLAITPTGDQCTNVARTVTVTATPAGAPVTGVTIDYTVNGGPVQTVNMTNTGGNDWSGIIPTVTPANGTVGWSVTATDGNNLTQSATGTSYTDEPLASVVASATSTTVCSGSPTTLSGAVTSTNSSAAPAAASYCVSTHTSGCSGDNISRVVLNTLDNLTGTSCGGAARYTYFNGGGAQTTTLAGGALYTVSLTFGADGNQYFGAWIDYDHNGTYDASEFLGASGNAGVSGTIGVSFTVPTTAYNGLTHIRIVGGNDAPVTSTQACGVSSSTWGETQDYDITITGATQVSTSSPYTGPATFSWSDGTSEVGTTNPLTVNPTQNTTYTLTVTALGCTKASAPLAITTIALPNAPNANNSLPQCGTAIPAAFVTTNFPSGSTGAFRWYDAQTNGNLLQTGGGTYAGTISSTTIFWVSESDGTCESVRTQLTAFVNPPDPIEASADDNTPCANTAIQLSASNSAPLPQTNTYTFSWTAIPEAGSGLPSSTTGPSISVTPTIPGTYQYVATAVDQTCTTTDTVVVTVSALPQIPTPIATPSTACAGDDVTLSVPQNFIVPGPQTLPGTYCVPSQPGSAQITEVDFNTLSLSNISQTTPFYTIYPATGAATTTVTAGQTYTLTLATIEADGPSIVSVWIDYNRNGIFDPTEWYQPWVAATTGSINITIPANAAAGATGMRIRSRFGGNPSAATDACSVFGSGVTVDFTLNVLGLSPVNPTYTYVWNPGGLPGATVTVNPTISTQYTVTATDPATGCEAPETVDVEINPLPATPSANSSEHCGTQVPEASVSSNSSPLPPSPVFNWYSAPTGGTLLQSGTSNTYLTAVSTTTTFYVAEVSALGCIGPRVAVIVDVIIADPVTASATATTICLGASTDLSASYVPDNNTYTFSWTASPASGSGVPVSVPGPTVTVTPTAAGTYIYTVTGFDADKGCSTTSTVSITVNPAPFSSASASAASVCAGTTVNLFGGLAAPLINEGFNTVSPLPAGWASQNLSTPVGLLGWFQGNTAVFDAFSGPATSYIAANFNNVAGGNPISNWLFLPNITMTNGDVFSFYTRQEPAQARPDRMEVRLSTNGASVNAGATNTSVGDFTTLLLTINPASTPTGYPPAWTKYTITISGLSGPTSGRLAFRYNIDNGGPSGTNSDFIGIDEVVYTQVPTFSWSSNPVGFTSSLQNPENVVVNANTIFTLTSTNGYGCSSSSDVTVNTIALPAAPIGTNSTQCGLAVPTASVSTGGSNGTFDWYDAETGGTLLQAGGSTYTTAISATTTFWVSENNGTCNSLRTPVTVTVATPGVISVDGSGPATICLNSTISLTASSLSPYVYTWTASPAAGSGIPTNEGGASVTVTPTAPGTYVYTVTGVDNSGPNTCTGTATYTATVNPNPIVDSIKATPATICASGSSVLSVYSSGIGAGPQTPPVGYLPSTATDPADEDILNVTFGSLNNSSTCSETGGGASVQNQYSDYTSLPAPTVTAGQAVSFSVAGGTCDGNWGNKIGVYIDYNRDGVFGAGETAYVDATTVVGPHTVSGTITIPATAKGGVTLMRVIVVESATINPTGTYTWGETEDYLVNIIGNITQNPDLTYLWNPGALAGNTVTVNPTITTNYTATLTNPATGCSTISSPVTVTVTPVIASASATPTPPVCAGTAVTLNANPTGGAPFSFSWSDGTSVVGTTNPLIVTPLVTTTYTVTVTDACSNVTTSSVTVTVNPKPTASIAEPGPITICSPATQTLNAVTTTANPSYQWLSNGVNIGGATTSSYIVTSTGAYRVVITETSTGCRDTSAAISVTINSQPQPVVITPADPTICAGGNVTLTATSGSSGSGTVGTGAVANTLSTPYKGFWGGQKVQYLYTAAELSTLGMTAGVSITTIGMNITAFLSPYTFNGFTIGMKLTSATALTGIPESGTTTVFGPTNFTLSGTAPFAVTHTLSSGFTWNGTSNLIVEFCFNNVNGGGSSTNSANVASSTITGRASYFSSDNNANVCTTASGWTTSTTRANMAFTYSSVSPITSWSPAAGLNTTTGGTVIASPAVTTTYTATATNAAGCTNTSNVTVTVVQPFVSPTPVPVTGITNVCPYIGLGNPEGLLTYSLPLIPGATYNWVLPPTNVTLVSGQGTNSISILVNNGFETQANKQIRVTQTVPCGTPSAVRIFYMLAQYPSTPGPITGPTDVCPYLGTGLATYSVAPVTAATSYIWTAQAGSIITYPNGTGVNSNTINVAFAPGFTTSAITVRSTNECGVSGLRSILITRNNPATPSLIAGPTNVCAHMAPNGTPATYTVPQLPGITYTWSVPAGATGLTGQGTNSISFLYPAAFTTGAVSVTATSGCGTSPARSLNVTKLNPATPGVVDVIQTGFCEDPGGRQFSYTIASMPSNATSVQWTIPAGATLVSGQGTTSIVVTYPPTAITDSVTAQAVNNCATSVKRKVVIKLPACPPPGLAGKGTSVVTPAATGSSFEVKIFPNPTVSDFRLEVLTASKEQMTVRVLDAQGRLFKSFKLMAFQTITLGAELKAGSYLVEVRQGREVKTTKVIKF